MGQKQNQEKREGTTGNLQLTWFLVLARFLPPVFGLCIFVLCGNIQKFSRSSEQKNLVLAGGIPDRETLAVCLGEQKERETGMSRQVEVSVCFFLCCLSLSNNTKKYKWEEPKPGEKTKNASKLQWFKSLLVVVSDRIKEIQTVDIFFEKTKVLGFFFLWRGFGEKTTKKRFVGGKEKKKKTNTGHPAPSCVWESGLLGRTIFLFFSPLDGFLKRTKKGKKKRGKLGKIFFFFSNEMGGFLLFK